MSMLLLAFFLILASEVQDPPTFIHSESGTGYRSTTTGEKEVVIPIWELLSDLDAELASEVGSGRLRLVSYPNELRLQFVDAQFFETGSADLSVGGIALIARIIAVLSNLTEYEYHIDVEGHTDDLPIESLRFRSNWELSAARAATIVRNLVSSGFPPDRLKASGFADTRSIAPNRDASGRPLPEQMALNRRIVFRIHYDLENTP
jgi:chemotaxis protein MotB